MRNCTSRTATDGRALLRNLARAPRHGPEVSPLPAGPQPPRHKEERHPLSQENGQRSRPDSRVTLPLGRKSPVVSLSSIPNLNRVSALSLLSSQGPRELSLGSARVPFCGLVHQSSTRRGGKTSGGHEQDVLGLCHLDVFTGTENGLGINRWGKRRVFQKKGVVAPPEARVVFLGAAGPSCLQWCPGLDVRAGDAKAQEEGPPSPMRHLPPQPPKSTGGPAALSPTSLSPLVSSQMPAATTAMYQARCKEGTQVMSFNLPNSTVRLVSS